MNDALLKVLSWVDTATVCSAIEIAQGRRGFDHFTKSPPLAVGKDALPLVGFARTAKVAGASPPDEPIQTTKERRLDYYRYVNVSKEPSVMVIEDTDGTNCVGAFWGQLNATIHKKLGVSGVLTNGLVRDLDDLPEAFPVLAGSVGPSHGFIHVREFGSPVNVFGLNVQEHDFIHADQHGAVVIPPDVLPNIQNAIVELVQIESTILKPLDKDDFQFSDFEAAWKAFENRRV